MRIRNVDPPELEMPLTALHESKVLCLCLCSNVEAVCCNHLRLAGFKPSVYLPLYVPMDSCVKSPLYLCYRRGHFAPLVFLKQLDASELESARFEPDAEILLTLVESKYCDDDLLLLFRGIS